MALYFDRALNTPSGNVTVHSAWQKVSGHFAVCSASPGAGAGFVDIFNAEGEKKTSKEHAIQRSCQPTICSWHPIKNILAVGWENGELVIYNGHNDETHEVPTLHTQAITSICWSTNGSRLASGDKVGVAAVWRADDRGRIQHNPVCRFEIGAEVTQCITPTSSSNENIMSKIASLARAAVSGDEKALDLFATLDTKKGSKLQMPSVADGLSFYFGAKNGEIFYIDGKGHEHQCMKMENSVHKLMYFSAKEALVSISSDLQVVLSRVHGDGKTEELYRAKLSGQGNKSDMTWASEGLLASATSDHSLRMWNLNSDDNYTLSLDTALGFDSDERITSVAYSDQKRILAASTNKCKIAMWNFSPMFDSKTIQDAESQWLLQQATTIETEALHIEWCNRKAVLAVNHDSGVTFLTEQRLNWAISNRILAVQTAPKQAFVEISPEQSTQSMGVPTLSPTRSMDQWKSPTHSQKPVQTELNTEIFFTGIAVSKDALAVWNGSQVVVYDVVNNTLILAGNFFIESTVNALHDQSFFTVESGNNKENNKVQVRNFKGTVKQVLQFQDKEGEVVHLDVCGNFLVAATNQGVLRIYDLSRRDAKPHCNSKNMAELIPYFGLFKSIKCNSAGTRVAMVIKQDNQVTSPKLYIYNVEKDRVDLFDFASGKSGDGDLMRSTEAEENRIQNALDVAGRYPLSIHWDTEEPCLLVCEAQLSDNARRTPVQAVTSSSSIGSDTHEIPIEQLIVLLYSTTDEGVLVQDSFKKSIEQSAIIGLRVPNFYFTKAVISKAEKELSKENGESVTFSSKPFSNVPMRDFVGLEDCDPTTRRAMLDFSFNLTLGNMDEAFKAIKLIKSEAVWESMAKMCVKTRRVDVAKVCLGRMGHVRGAQALRLADKEPEVDARIAMLALQLGMNDEAERLYRKCQRFDLLNEFYQATGKWAKALEIAEQFDRVHLRTTFHNYAKHLEQSEEIAGAIPMFEKAGTHSFEVPRMLFDDIDMLETYVLKSKNKTFLRWWAQYMESTGEMETALKYYDQAGDIFSLVRVYCYCGKVEKAAGIANETKNRAACYHLARHFENSDDIKQAIHFYTCAATYGNAIRICKEHGFEDQLMNLALLSSPTDMVEAATYYETRPDLVEKAVLLYHKAGHFSKALKLAFDTQQFGALESIAQDLDERADPVLLERCANFFMEHQQYDKAVSLLVIAKKYPEAVDLCLQNSVKLDESLVERLTPDKDMTPSSGTREQLLIKLGDCCMKQGSYHLACKKYTQAGDREKAMRALLKSGDTEKIIFFAGVSRSRNIYVMAANYLQSLDWRKDPEIMKHIINYYTKGRALDSLAGFYDACAQVEIDEYQNYDKALGAMTEAFKCLSKAKMANKQQQEDKVTELKTRIALVKKFIQAKRLFDSDSLEATKQCQVLLAENDLDSAVRIGDVYGVLIENYAHTQDYEKAYQMMQEMQRRIPTVNMAYYVNMRTIETVHQALGVSQGRSNNTAVVGKTINSGFDSDDEDLDKNDISEEIYDNGDSSVDMYRFR
ncbi:intraflagellar transport protein 140 homolog [Styela clava]